MSKLSNAGIGNLIQYKCLLESTVTANYYSYVLKLVVSDIASRIFNQYWLRRQYYFFQKKEIPGLRKKYIFHKWRFAYVKNNLQIFYCPLVKFSVLLPKFLIY